MNGWFIFAMIIAMLAGACGLVSLATKGDRGKKKPGGDPTDGAYAHGLSRLFFWGLTVVAAIMVFFCSFTPVGPREIGVVSTFGSLTGHLGSGPNMIWPWEQETTIDGSYQYTEETFKVRIAGGQTADATVQVNWNATQEAADDIYGNFKNTLGMEKKLLDPSLNKATNTALDGYNPLVALASGAKIGTADNPSTAQLGANILALLQPLVGRDIQINNFNLKPLTYDVSVQNQLNTAYTQAGKTVQAQLAEKTAQAQALANQALQQGLAGDPLVLVQQCMTAISSGEFKPPPGFTCWPGAGSGIVLPTSTTTTTTTPAKGK